MDIVDIWDIVDNCHIVDIVDIMEIMDIWDIVDTCHIVDIVDIMDIVDIWILWIMSRLWILWTASQIKVLNKGLYLEMDHLGHISEIHENRQVFSQPTNSQLTAHSSSETLNLNSGLGFEV